MLIKLPRKLFKAEIESEDQQLTILEQIELENNKDQMKLFIDQKTMKAVLSVKDGKLLMKSKTYQVGEVSEKTGKKKVAPGKWEDVKGQKPSQKQEPENKTEPKKDEKQKGKLAKVKEAMVTAMKGLMDSLQEYYSGRTGEQEVAGGVSQAGEKLKSKEQKKNTQPNTQPSTQPEQKQEPVKPKGKAK